MITLSIISLLCIAAICAYMAYFFKHYRVIPPSLSQTAEYPGCYYFFQVVICFIFGYLQYYYPIIYPYSEYGWRGILLNAGCAGLALAGYYSYKPGDDKKRDLTIHKVGSMVGGVLIMLFYAIVIGWWIPILALVIGAIALGVKFKGHRYGVEEPDNSITFWVEMCIVIVISFDLIRRAVGLFF